MTTRTALPSTLVDKKARCGARYLHEPTDPKTLPPLRAESLPLHSLKKVYRRFKAKHSTNAFIIYVTRLSIRVQHLDCTMLNVFTQLVVRSKHQQLSPSRNQHHQALEYAQLS
jgi:hypothetical protein